MSIAISPPSLNQPQQAQRLQTQQILQAAIVQANGRLPFDQFMDLALYAPGAGYYVNGSHKLGVQGDFVTAPEISSLFSQCLANQVAQVLASLSQSEILEFGAGSGRMAADVLMQLQRLDGLPERYLILEVSPDLRLRQQEVLQHRVPDLVGRVEWIETLPAVGWQGVVLANEVLDAMPVHRFRWTGEDWQEAYVTYASEVNFAECWDAVQSPGLLSALRALGERIGVLPTGYQSEVNLRMHPWLAAIAGFMQRGAVLLIDYGYTEREYYHPERTEGTLICHFQHQAYTNPYERVGLQDITANVDFSALAHAGLDVGFSLAGYTPQAHFLLDNGWDGLFQGIDDSMQGLQKRSEAKRLLLPTEMGERFKVMAFVRALDMALQGFQSRDMRAYL